MVHKMSSFNTDETVWYKNRLYKVLINGPDADGDIVIKGMAENVYVVVNESKLCRGDDVWAYWLLFL